MFVSTTLVNTKMPPPQSTATKANVIEPLEPKAGLLEMVQVVENKKRNLEKRKVSFALICHLDLPRLTMVFILCVAKAGGAASKRR